MNDAHNVTATTTPAPAGSTSPANVADANAGLSTPMLMPTPEASPGDDAPAGTIGTGEDTCPRCSGTGKVDTDRVCPDCDGTGIIIQGIGGG